MGGALVCLFVRGSVCWRWRSERGHLVAVPGTRTAPIDCSSCVQTTVTRASDGCGTVASSGLRAGHDAVHLGRQCVRQLVVGCVAPLRALHTPSSHTINTHHTQTSFCDVVPKERNLEAGTTTWKRFNEFRRGAFDESVSLHRPQHCLDGGRTAQQMMVLVVARIEAGEALHSCTPHLASH